MNSLNPSNRSGWSWKRVITVRTSSSAGILVIKDIEQELTSKNQRLARWIKVSLYIAENHTWSVIMHGDLHQAVVAFQDGHKVLIDLRVIFVGLFDRADIVDSALIHGCVLRRNSCCCCTQNRRRSRSMKMKTNKRASSKLKAQEGERRMETVS